MQDIIERNGRTYQITIEYDDDSTPPWEREDGHGPVSDWTSRAKRPGERVLNQDRRSYRYYDFAAAVKKAKEEGWDAEPYSTGTAGERAHRAAEEDYRRIKAWCDDNWHYVGVVVTPLCKCCGNPIPDKSESLWGIESDSDDYLETVALELVAQAEG